MTTTSKKLTISETELSHRTGIDRHAVPGILTEAGIVPVSTIARKNGEVRIWPRVESLAALRGSEAALIKKYRNTEAVARARILEIKSGLRDGTLITRERHEAELRRIVAAVSGAFKKFHSRHAHDFANANALHPNDDTARRAAIAAAIAPTFDACLAAIRPREDL